MRDKKNIIMIIMCISVFVMAVGYAIFQTSLNIGATGNITTSWGISITNITSSLTGTAVNVTDPTYTGVSATFNAGFYKPGDKVTYTITVSNNGDIDAIISDVIINTTGSSDIIYTVEGLEKNQELLKKTTASFTVVAEFDTNAIVIPTITEKTINMVLVVTQSDGTSPTPIAPEITDDTTQWGVMYVANGGTGTMEGTVCTVGTSCTLATNTFTREGYLFKGWSTTPTGDVQYTDGQTVTDIVTPGKTVTLYAVWDYFGELGVLILTDNTAQSDTNIDFSKISSDTNGKGLYYTSTNTEDNKTTYYFRGDVENNYVKFGTMKSGGTCTYNGIPVDYYDASNSHEVTTKEECLSTYVCDYGSGSSMALVNTGSGYCTATGGTYTSDYATWTDNYGDIIWRIVRINEDGSIRLITQDSIGTSDFNYVDYETVRPENADVGYMYGTRGSSTYALTHANDNPSTIKTYIDNWYVSNLSNYSSYLADAGFCNDRSVAPSAGLWTSIDTALGYGTNVTYYGAYNRLRVNKTPQFACPNTTNDLFTISTSSKGNKALDYPIGLITADEVAYAGGVDNTTNESMYLTNGGYWTMSPSSFDGTYGNGWVVPDNGYVDSVITYGSGYGVRPVINLKSIIGITDEIPSGCTKQNGTENCPYIIDTNN